MAIVPEYLQPYMIKLSGKDYLQVNGRILMFRQEAPTGIIETEIQAVGSLIIAKAWVLVDGKALATGHATVREGKGQKWAGREIEKAETAAIGRALAHAGYGTQFAFHDMDEGDYLADAPIEPKNWEQTMLEKRLTNKGALWEHIKNDIDIRFLYQHENHLVNTMKLYTDEFGAEPIEHGFDTVKANLLARKEVVNE